MPGRICNVDRVAIARGNIIGGEPSQRGHPVRVHQFKSKEHLAKLCVYALLIFRPAVADQLVGVAVGGATPSEVMKRMHRNRSFRLHQNATEPVHH